LFSDGLASRKWARGLASQSQMGTGSSQPQVGKWSRQPEMGKWSRQPELGKWFCQPKVDYTPPLALGCPVSPQLCDRGMQTESRDILDDPSAKTSDVQMSKKQIDILEQKISVLTERVEQLSDNLSVLKGELKPPLPVPFALPLFSGRNDEQFAQWIQRFEIMLRLQRVSSDPDKVLLLRAYLEYPAATIFDSLPCKETSDFEGAKTALSHFFVNSKYCFYRIF
jgi:hypothetical protein